MVELVLCVRLSWLERVLAVCHSGLGVAAPTGLEKVRLTLEGLEGGYWCVERYEESLVLERKKPELV